MGCDGGPHRWRDLQPSHARHRHLAENRRTRYQLRRLTRAVAAFDCQRFDRYDLRPALPERGLKHRTWYALGVSVWRDLVVHRSSDAHAAASNWRFRLERERSLGPASFACRTSDLRSSHRPYLPHSGTPLHTI